jgi:hypothetical protein
MKEGEGKREQNGTRLGIVISVMLRSRCNRGRIPRWPALNHQLFLRAPCVPKNPPQNKNYQTNPPLVPGQNLSINHLRQNCLKPSRKTNPTQPSPTPQAAVIPIFLRYQPSTSSSPAVVPSRTQSKQPCNPPVMAAWPRSQLSTLHSQLFLITYHHIKMR